MAEKKVPFGHQGFQQRMRAIPFRINSAAENVAMNQGMADVAKVAVDGWISSPGHCKNLLAKHTYCAIGVYCNSVSNKWYLTQLVRCMKLVHTQTALFSLLHRGKGENVWVLYFNNRHNVVLLISFTVQ